MKNNCGTVRACALAAGLVAGTVAYATNAQQVPYPTKAIQLVAQQPPGSASDSMSRIWAECASRELGHPIMVHNKPGANGILAIDYVKGRPADGYTIMSTGMSQMSITPYVHVPQPYDPAKDFVGIATFGSTPLILTAAPASSITQLSDLQAVGKSMQGGLNFGSPGKGSPAQLLTTALTQRLGIPATHVPFVGEAAGMTATMTGEIQIMALVIGTAAPQIKEGRLVPLAVFDSERSPLLPDVPAIAELANLSDLARPSWMALVAKADTPPAIVERLNAATQQCNHDSLFRSRLEKMSVVPMATSSEDVMAMAARDAAVWRPLIDQLGLTKD